MGVNEAVVVRFREILAQRDMRPNELAYRSGVTPSTVYKWMITCALIRRGMIWTLRFRKCA